VKYCHSDGRVQRCLALKGGFTPALEADRVRSEAEQEGEEQGDGFNGDEEAQ
jgi:hypothetical protein